jgi:hypothetical protein
VVTIYRTSIGSNILHKEIKAAECLASFLLD